MWQENNTTYVRKKIVDLPTIKNMGNLWGSAVYKLSDSNRHIIAPAMNQFTNVCSVYY
jgi:hypothetical protein